MGDVQRGTKEVVTRDEEVRGPDDSERLATVPVVDHLLVVSRETGEPASGRHRVQYLAVGDIGAVLEQRRSYSQAQSLARCRVVLVGRGNEGERRERCLGEVRRVEPVEEVSRHGCLQRGDLRGQCRSA